MMHKYWNKNKRDLLPWVKDWTDPQDHLRYSNNVRDMSYNDWFYCHPSAYSLIYYGTSFSALTMFGIGAGLSAWFNYTFTLIICSMVGLVFAMDCAQKVYKWNDIKRTTFYDMHMREYEGEDL